MPYLIKVGYEITNKNKTTSKAYFLKRSGKKLFISWGAIDVFALRTHKFYWKGKYPQERVEKFYTEKEAKEAKREIINSKLLAGYQRLPSLKIYKRNFR